MWKILGSRGAFRGGGVYALLPWYEETLQIENTVNIYNQLYMA